MATVQNPSAHCALLRFKTCGTMAYLARRWPATLLPNDLQQNLIPGDWGSLQLTSDPLRQVLRDNRIVYRPGHASWSCTSPAPTAAPWPARP